MPLLQFMPWCSIDKIYRAGQVTLLYFDKDKRPDDQDELTFGHIKTIMSSYRNLEEHPVRRSALIKYTDKHLLADLSEDEMETTRECIDIACFAGLSNREYFNPLGPYCNADSFIHYGQRFADDSSFIAVTSKRREGTNWNARPLTKTVFSVPPHADAIREVRLDEPLLSALFSHRESTEWDQWGRWQNAISCFNKANTDSDTVSYQVEWVLLTSAFEHVLGAASNARDVASKFSNSFVPASPLTAGDSKRKSAKMHDPDSFIRYEWMREFYRVRGDFAHGKLRTIQEMAWGPLEHMLLAAIAFPLVLKILLEKKGKYTLTSHDRATVDAFERVSDENFLNPPLDRENVTESWLHRLTAEARWEMATRRIAMELAERRASESREE